MLLLGERGEAIAQLCRHHKRDASRRDIRSSGGMLCGVHNSALLRFVHMNSECTYLGIASMGDEIEAFLARLQRVLDGRKPYPWAAENGLSRGAIGRLLKGQLPDPDKLLQVIRNEGLSLSWLMTGQGTPFLFHAPATDAQAAELIGQLSTEMGQPRALIVRNADDPQRVVVVLSELVRKEPVEGEPYEYRHAEVIAGPACSGLAAAAARRESAEAEERNLPSGAWRRLASGYMSLPELWSTKTTPVVAVATQRPEGQTVLSDLSDQERRVVEALRTASSPVRATVVAMVEAAVGK